MDFLLMAWPFWFMALIFLICTITSYRKHNTRKSELFKATVIELKRNSKRNDSCYLIKETYDITLQYYYNGMYQIETIKDHPFAFDVGDVVDIYVSGNKPVIFTKTNNCFYSHNVVHPTGYKILFLFFIMFFSFPIMSVCSENQWTELIPTVCFIGLLEFVFFKKKLKLEDEIKSYDKMISSGFVECVKTNVVDLRKDTRRSGNHYSVYYYPNIEYEYNGKRYFYCVPNNVEIGTVKQGDIIDCKVDINTGKIIDEEKLKRKKIYTDLYKWCQIFVAVFGVIVLCSTLFSNL